MGSCYGELNDILTALFNKILKIEQRALSTGQFKDISITEIHTLEAIGDGGGRSMTKVAAQLDITMGTLTTAISRLINKGYVETNRAKNDRRVVNVSLTHKGRILNRLHKKFHFNMVNTVMEGMDDDEQKLLMKSAGKLLGYFNAFYDRAIERGQKIGDSDIGNGELSAGNNTGQ